MATSPRLPSVPPAVTRRVRQRNLAGDARAGLWARGKARRAQQAYLRAHWRLLSTAAVAMTAPTAVAALLVPGTLARGFLLGAGLAGTTGALAYWTLQVTGTAPTMMGELAEQWTAGELRQLRRRGWFSVNHVRLRAWDIDHVLVGPAGCYSLETKWSAHPWQLDPPEPRLREAARQARNNARDLRLWQDFKAAGVVDVQPVLMLWGAGTALTGVGSDELLVDGVPVVLGPASARWRAKLLFGAPTLSPSQVELAWSALDHQARRRDERDPESIPPSLVGLLTRAVLVVMAAAAGFVAAVSLLPVVDSLLIWISSCALLAAAAVPLRRHRPTRLSALAVQTGLGAAMLLVAAAAVFDTFR